MEIYLLASGSRGNALLLGSEQDGYLLIDNGLSARGLEARLALAGRQPGDIVAIIVTHEHQDHCRGVGPLARRWKLPVYINGATQEAAPRLGPLPRVEALASGRSLHIAGMTVEAFSIPHDAVASVGLVLTHGARRTGIATDMGMATRLAVDALQGCEALILETNHDPNMLWEGPYPWPLKQRIASRLGHLSNEQAACLLQEVAWPGLEELYLAHLSETNNTPDKALAAVNPVLEKCCPHCCCYVGSPQQPVANAR